MKALLLLLLLLGGGGFNLTFIAFPRLLIVCFIYKFNLSLEMVTSDSWTFSLANQNRVQPVFSQSQFGNKAQREYCQLYNLYN